MSEDELKELLVGANMVSSDELEKAVEEQHKINQPLEKVLLTMKIVEKDALYQLLSEHLNVKYKNLDGLQVPDEVVKIYPEDLARSTKSIPLFIKDEVLHIAMEDN